MRPRAACWHSLRPGTPRSWQRSSACRYCSRKPSSGGAACEPPSPTTATSASPTVTAPRRLPLGVWITRQRQAHTHGRLDTERIQQLDDSA
ncbi:helicase associated domain-containing protein [Actinacidiphila glaucinigra]|uniref:helicase associated domain-containing protein n=1 Tax=Actinacidiphila glaucinigra TaxID=235986 RepID=UPI003F4B8DB0